MGSPVVYPFDGHWSRILDANRLVMSRDSIERVARAGKQVWFVVPSKWLSDTLVLADTTALSESEALRERAEVLRRELQRQFGSPMAAISTPERSWNLESLTVERFGSAAVPAHE
jgi:hypothetical protein